MSRANHHNQHQVVRPDRREKPLNHGRSGNQKKKGQQELRK